MNEVCCQGRWLVGVTFSSWAGTFFGKYRYSVGVSEGGLFPKNEHFFWWKRVKKCFFPPYLVSCGHDGHHREFLDLHLCDAHSGQEADLRRAHVGALCEHTLPTFNVMTDGPVSGQQRRRFRGKSRRYLIEMWFWVWLLKGTVHPKIKNTYFSAYL